MSGFVTPAAAAMSSIETAWNPRSAKARSARSSSCASRSARGIFFVPPRGDGARFSLTAFAIRPILLRVISAHPEREVPMTSTRRGRLAITILLACLVGPLLLPSGANSKVEQAALNEDGRGNLRIDGSRGNDDISIRVISGAIPSDLFYEGSAPGGVVQVPNGCFRKDANTIHCPHNLVKAITVDTREGNDRVRWFRSA